MTVLGSWLLNFIPKFCVFTDQANELPFGELPPKSLSNRLDIHNLMKLRRISYLSRLKNRDGLFLLKILLIYRYGNPIFSFRTYTKQLPSNRVFTVLSNGNNPYYFV